ncbi:unnamed protein product [Calicophoron daubneyi]|uniref:Transmembrane protein n=1 Tax=Calicophoron daubneyi TaxID=300641 RepID=A0AAV2SW17_CALDB
MLAASAKVGRYQKRHMEEPETSGGILSYLKLKSLLAIFVGLFCILCFKKLIELGRRWKNIIVDWGYRTLNVPSLWRPDTVSDTEDGSGVREGSTSSLGVSTRGGKQRQRVPALRLPDAWPNFFLTWLYLNIDTMSAFIPAWLSAVNDELTKLTSQSKKHPGENKEPSDPVHLKLEFKSVLKHSAPPRLSSIETSASGSTKELHFNCTLFSPELNFELEVSQNPPGSSSPSSHQNSKPGVTYLIRMQQVTCRAQLICAALEGDYVMLSSKLISPLLVSSFSVLTQDGKPTSELSKCELRWIKDMAYLAMQSAVTRLVFSPLCVAPVHKCPNARELSRPELHTPIERKISTISQTAPAHSRSGTLLSPMPFPPNDSTVPANSMYLRVVTAILLEPTDPQTVGALTEFPLRCQLLSNSYYGPTVTPRLSAKDDASLVLATTPGVFLESRAWPNERPRSNAAFHGLGHHLNAISSSATNASMAVWNYDACIPMEKIQSNLLDVVLFTEPETVSPTSSRICGRAVLPLPTTSEPTSKSQHVLLIDCHLTTPQEDEERGIAARRLNSSPESNRTATTTSVQSSPIKFMLILRAQLLTGTSVDTQASRNHLERQSIASSTSANGTAVTDTDIDAQHTTPLSTLKPQLSRDRVSAEQISQFMSSPSDLTFGKEALDGSNEVYSHKRSQSFGGCGEPKDGTLTPGGAVSTSTFESLSHPHAHKDPVLSDTSGQAEQAAPQVHTAQENHDRNSAFGALGASAQKQQQQQQTQRQQHGEHPERLVSEFSQADGKRKSRRPKLFSFRFGKSSRHDLKGGSVGYLPSSSPENSPDLDRVVMRNVNDHRVTSVELYDRASVPSPSPRTTHSFGSRVRRFLSRGSLRRRRFDVPQLHRSTSNRDAHSMT